MNNDNVNDNQNTIDVYAHDPRQGQERNRVEQDTQTTGRETGNAWGNDQQMGSSTDTTDRRNPAG